MNSKFNTKQQDSFSNTSDESSTEMDIKPIIGFQDLQKAVGVQADLHHLLPPTMYARFAAIEKSQKDHENMFGRLTSIIDELSERYSRGNFSPDRISSEGYASKNTTTSGDDIFEVSSNAESSSVSSFSIKIEDNDPHEYETENDDLRAKVEAESTTENEREEDEYDDDDDEDVATRKSQRIIRPRTYSDMIYDHYLDDKHSHKSDDAKSVATTSIASRSPDPDNMLLSDSIPTSTSDEQSESMIQIGPHGTMINAMEYNSIPWDSASTATRKLLGYVFDVETLATHSLTGRPSPAFFGRERPHKNQLDQEKIADIITAVTVRTGATERDIRAAITTKCADTTKMYKIKQNRMKKFSL